MPEDSARSAIAIGWPSASRSLVFVVAGHVSAMRRRSSTHPGGFPDTSDARDARDSGGAWLARSAGTVFCSRSVKIRRVLLIGNRVGATHLDGFS